MVLLAQAREGGLDVVELVLLAQRLRLVALLLSVRIRVRARARVRVGARARARVAVSRAALLGALHAG